MIPEREPDDPCFFCFPEKIGIVHEVFLPTGAVRLVADLTSQVQYGGEQGLLGIALHPDFASNGLFYFYLDHQLDLTEVVEIPSVGLPGNVSLLLGGERVVVSFPQTFTNHNGGWIGFNPKDGFLYISKGDGGSGNDPFNHAQDSTSPLGKILRIDVNAVPFAIPPSNPFATSPSTYSPLIFALGMRNPWRCGFSCGGELFCGDVGQSNVEEVDIITLGGNYGWRNWEGTRCNISPCNRFGTIGPIAEYTHAVGVCVIGGVVVNQPDHRAWHGTYFFGDLSWAFGLLVPPLPSDATSAWTMKQLHLRGDNCGFPNTYEGAPHAHFDIDGEVYQLTGVGGASAADQGRLYRIIQPQSCTAGGPV